MHTYRILHPRIGDQDPKGGKSCSYDRQPGGSQVEAFAHLVPTEKHHGYKSRFHKERQNSFDSKGSSEDVSYKPTVIRPVRSEFEFEDQPGGNTDSEVNTKQFHPELRCLFPELVTCFVIDGLHDGLYNAEPQCQGHEQPMIHGSESELRS